MGIFNQFKEAQEAMKNMSPDEIRQMMDQAKEAQKQLEIMIEQKVKKIIEEKELVSREEVRKMLEK